MIKGPQIVQFLKALQARIARNWLIIWDRLQAHRSKLVRAHVEAQRSQIMIVYLPIRKNIAASAEAIRINQVDLVFLLTRMLTDEEKTFSSTAVKRS